MLPYEKMIRSVFVDGKCQGDVYEKLQQADGRVLRALIKVLHESPDPDTREICAELLSEHECARAVPALIEALDDPEWHVRFDVISSIEIVCQYQIGGLRDWLNLDIDHPREMKKRVKKWWQVEVRVTTTEIRETRFEIQEDGKFVETQLFSSVSRESAALP